MRSVRNSLLGAVVAVLALGAAGAASAAPKAGDPSLTARIDVPVTARAAPRGSGRPLLRLAGVTTWTGTAQRLLVTGRHRDGDGDRWVRVQLPVRPNGRGAWVPASTVTLSETRTRIRVLRGVRRLELWRDGRRAGAWRAGVGRPGTPTPLGRFAIQDPVPTLPAWRGVYGSWTLTLTAHSPTLRSFMGGDALVAIHGAGSRRSWRVGTASSYGCVILSEPALAAVARHARAGTPVDVLP